MNPYLVLPFILLAAILVLFRINGYDFITNYHKWGDISGERFIIHNAFSPPIPDQPRNKTFTFPGVCFNIQEYFEK